MCYATDWLLNYLLTNLRRTNNLEIKPSQWTDMNNRKQTYYGTSNFSCIYVPRLLKAAATELANYKLDFVFVGEFRLNKVGIE
jgi:hypothetical protein